MGGLVRRSRFRVLGSYRSASTRALERSESCESCERSNIGTGQKAGTVTTRECEHNVVYDRGRRWCSRVKIGTHVIPCRPWEWGRKDVKMVRMRRDLHSRKVVDTRPRKDSTSDVDL
jgi:hypothetical protein